MGKVHNLPPSTTLTVEQALFSALGVVDTIADVIIIGYDSEGELIIRSSQLDRKAALWLIKQAELYTLRPD
jgi:hypothetical protein